MRAGNGQRESGTGRYRPPSGTERSPTAARSVVRVVRPARCVARCVRPVRCGWCSPTLRRPVSPEIPRSSLDPMAPAHGTQCQTASATPTLIPSAHPNEVRRPATRSRRRGSEESAAGQAARSWGRRDPAGVVRERPPPGPSSFRGNPPAGLRTDPRGIALPASTGGGGVRQASQGRGNEGTRRSTADAPAVAVTGPKPADEACSPSACRTDPLRPVAILVAGRPAWRRCAAAGRGTGLCGPPTQLALLPGPSAPSRSQRLLPGPDWKPRSPCLIPSSPPGPPRPSSPPGPNRPTGPPDPNRPIAPPGPTRPLRLPLPPATPPTRSTVRS